MAFSRREFLGLAAGSAAFGVASRLRVVPSGHGAFGPPPDCALIDCGAACTIRESVAGYESALKASGIPFCRVSVPPASAARTLIVPAAHLTEQSQLRQLKASLKRGSILLFESGATFLDQGEFDVHQRLIQSEFGISLGTARNLWGSANPSRQFPYISYNWPVHMKVRDFSRLIPVHCTHGEPIARFEGLPVAVKRNLGIGMLVFLGSPLGPHLLAGDREAQMWLKTICSQS
jgi:hypothetical protein